MFSDVVVFIELIFLLEKVTSAVTIDLRHEANCNRVRGQVYPVFT